MSNYQFPNESNPGFTNPGNTQVSHQSFPLSSSSVSSSILFDNFSRSDTTPGNLGISDNGWPWVMIGTWDGQPATQTRILNNVWASNAGDLAYAVFNSPIKIPEFGAMISFIPNSGAGDQASFAMALTKQTGYYFIYDLLHLSVNTVGWILSLRLNGGNFVTMASANFQKPLEKDGRKHLVRMSVYDTYFFITIGSFEFTVLYPPALGATDFRYVFFEHYYSSPDTSNLLRVHNIWTSDITRTTLPQYQNPVSMEYESGSVMTYEDGTVMTYEN